MTSTAIMPWRHGVPSGMRFITIMPLNAWISVSTVGRLAKGPVWPKPETEQ